MKEYKLFLQENAAVISIFLFFLVVLLFFTISADAFLTKRNLLNLIRQSAPILISAFAMTFVITTKGIDLSIGSTLAITNALCAILLQNESGGNPLIFFILVFGVFWFFMIRPQVKKQKLERKFRQELKKGDKVITSSGMHGKVVEVSENTLKLDVGSNIILKFNKSGISAELSNSKD